ncbi:MAG TPA: c-type cytochrome [Gemmatimonadaceae bacterium]|jgi:hypothetical protein
MILSVGTPAANVDDTRSRAQPRRRMRLAVLAALVVATVARAQTPGHFPPDSLVNTRVIPHSTPVIQVIGTMRNFSGDLGVRCQFCHIGQEGQPLEKFDFVSDEKRTKVVARQMMLMVADINRRIDSIPAGSLARLQVTCQTCHRGVSRPASLTMLMIEAATANGADSAIRAYRALKQRYGGRDTYDFSEPSLNIAAFRLGRANRVADGLALLNFNEELFPTSSGLAVFRGNLLLMRGDTTAAAAAFHEAIKRDSTNAEPRGRLHDINRPM